MEGRTLVERRRVRTVDPRVLHGDGRRAVERRLRELPALEERLVELQVEQRVQARVDGDAAVGGRCQCPGIGVGVKKERRKERRKERKKKRVNG